MLDVVDGRRHIRHSSPKYLNIYDVCSLYLGQGGEQRDVEDVGHQEQHRRHEQPVQDVAGQRAVQPKGEGGLLNMLDTELDYLFILYPDYSLTLSPSAIGSFSKNVVEKLGRSYCSVHTPSGRRLTRTNTVNM